MLAAVTEAIAADRQRRAADGDQDRLRSLYETLSPREREIMGLVTAGLMNKQVAARVQLKEITVKIHRGNVMRKMGAQSLADLVAWPSFSMRATRRWPGSAVSGSQRRPQAYRLRRWRRDRRVSPPRTRADRFAFVRFQLR